MFTITFTWHLTLMIILELIGLIWVLSVDNTDGFLGSDRDWATFLYIIVSIISWLIYGGFVWW